MSTRSIAPTFTVVVPTYNRARLLRRCVASVLGQSFGDFELVVVDDASTDETSDTVAGFGDRRVRGIRLQANRGVATARNRGIQLARGRYIAFLDDDDEYLPDFLRAMHGVLQGAPRTIGFAWSGIERVKDNGELPRMVERRMWQLASTRGRRPETAREAVSIGASFGLTVRTGCLASVGLFDEALRAGEDTDLLLRLVAADYGFVSIPEALVRNHDHRDTRLSDPANDHLRLSALRKMLREYREVLAVNRAVGDLLGRATRRAARLAAAPEPMPSVIEYPTGATR